MKKEKSFLEKAISSIISFFTAGIAMQAAPNVLSTIGDNLNPGTGAIASGNNDLNLNNTTAGLTNTIDTSLQSKTQSPTMSNEVVSKPRVRIQPLSNLTSTSNRPIDKNMENDFMPSFKRPGEM